MRFVVGFMPEIYRGAGEVGQRQRHRPLGGRERDLSRCRCALGLGAHGRLFAPGGDESGGDLDLSLDAPGPRPTARSSSTRRADTFIRDMHFTPNGSRLSGTLGETNDTVHAVLVKE